MVHGLRDEEVAAGAGAVKVVAEPQMLHLQSDAARHQSSSSPAIDFVAGLVAADVVYAVGGEVDQEAQVAPFQDIRWDNASQSVGSSLASFLSDRYTNNVHAAVRINQQTHLRRDTNISEWLTRLSHWMHVLWMPSHVRRYANRCSGVRVNNLLLLGGSRCGGWGRE